jgi:hypothetical protein
MVQSLPISELDLHEVKSKFGLQERSDDPFFAGLQQNSLLLTEDERVALDQIKANFLYLSEYPMSEEVVKMVVISPLLALAGFYQPPFRIKTEAPVQIAAEADSQIFRGRIDVLVLQEQFWILAVESKEAGFSLQPAIPQALAYMAATPHPDRPAYGFTTNGSEFLFLKLELQPQPLYILSDLLSLRRRDNELYSLLPMLKQIGQRIAA